MHKDVAYTHMIVGGRETILLMFIKKSRQA